MVNALAVLLFSSLTCVGLLAIWAATSPQHWFLRTVLFLGVMSLVLLIPAYEPFVVFLLQGTVVATGVQLANWWRNRDVKAERTGARFGLRTILLAMVPLAILTAVVAKLPELNVRGWQSVVLIGLVAGLATLTGLWIARGTVLHWWWRLLVGIVFAGILSLMLVWRDWFIAGVYFWQWPPPMEDGVNYPGFGLSEYRIVAEHHQAIWGLIVSAIAFCAAGVLTIVTHLKLSVGRTMERTARRIRKTLLGTCLLVVGLILTVPPAITYYQLMNPLPIPENDLPDPNGYDDFVAATRLLPANPTVEAVAFDPDTASQAQLKSALAEVAPSLELVRKGLGKQVWEPLDFTNNDEDFSTIYAFRTLMRALNADVIVAERKGDPSLAAEVSSQLVSFGNCLSLGATVSGAHLGIACAQVGCGNLYRILDKVSPIDCVQVASALASCESLLDSPQDVLHRQCVWTQHAMGWTVHLGHILLQTVSKVDSYDIFGYHTIDRCHRAIMRLLQLEYALRAWRAENSDWPEALDEMVPQFISAVPLDPFSTEGKPLQYIRTEDGYVLYSIGQNEIDEGGKAPDDEGIGWRGPETGDLRLDIHFAPDPSQSTGAVSTGNAETEMQESSANE
ncbi:M48 family metalloprotease [Bythopirellula goksoeyrii]|uniref:Type II secretion system protein GspG C-terminal domain-containing protein n=1 Tax=Bythopirellula goksoeyrii TaxID=1400387 RepID=A0A5B9QHC4_9BACT|nr:hypothetical protein [Bythopirellula goksoeyrii]QEG33583.1 hypothetical protein Pr1d_08470 [Bythopirellula goksoeyrii]